MAEAPRVDFNPYAPEVLASPEEHFGPLRAEYPVCQTEVDGVRVFILTRSSDVRWALGKHSLLTNRGGLGLHELPPEVGGYIVSTDGPEQEPKHQTYHQLMMQNLAPSALRQQEAAIQRIADDMVERVLQAGTFDARVFGREYIGQVLGGVIVGFPEAWWPNLMEWADLLTWAMGPRMTPDQYARMDELTAPFSELEQVVTPGKAGSAIFAAARQGSITYDEAVSLVGGAYGVAGLHTTVELWGHLFELFAQNPDQWELLRNDRSLMPGAIAEVLRHRTIFRRMYRRPSVEFKIRGYTIPAAPEPGIRVLLALESVNRDSDAWDEPERFNIARPYVAEKHLSLGRGLHACVGRWLANTEVEAVLNALLDRGVTGFQVSDAIPSPNNLVRGYSRLQVQATV